MLDETLYSLRLEQQGFDETRFTHLLGSPPPEPDEAPRWLRELTAAYTAPETSDGAFDGEVPEMAEAVFLDVVRPLLAHARRRLDRRMADLRRCGQAAGVGLERFAASWFEPLPRQLLWMVTRTLLLELRIGKIEERLAGPTPEDRFESFLAPLRSGVGALDLLRTYPVLGRSLAERVEQWIESGVELAERLLADLPALREVFGSLGDLVGLDSGLGDRHHGGRTVVSLEFSAGIKTLYKPRSLALDERFQELLGWLGEQGVEPRMRTLRLLDRGSWGWVEFVEHEPCRGAAEAERFYARMGIYLALLDLLAATDFHHENLIAAGEHPVLVDLETLLQPIFADSGSTGGRDLIAASILRVGLLPSRTSPGDLGLQGVDLSGLAARRGQARPIRELRRVGTDEMGFLDGLGEITVGRHRPTLDGEEIPLSSMHGVILESFASAWRALYRLRSEFLRPGGWLDRFRGLETRVILRSTGLYELLTYHAFHPDYLQDALGRERLFDKLWLDVEGSPHLAPVIPAEREDLCRGDFPRFTARTDSRDLFTSSGARIADALPESGLDLARRRLSAMGDDDLERQLAVIRLALESARHLGEDAVERQRIRAALPRAPSRAPRAADFLGAARRVGERLELLAVRSGEQLAWFGLIPTSDGYQKLEPVGRDLYNGMAGIALFLAQLGAVVGESRFTELACQALEAARRAPADAGLGAFTGLGGWIYVLTFCGAVWERPGLLDEAERARDEMSPAIANDEGLDVVSGVAGGLAALLALHRRRPSPDTLEAAVACGDHLLSRAEAQQQGVAWRVAAVAERPLAGFGHGAAGIAWALSRLAAASGEERFAEAARGAVAYERHLFSSRHGDWPDLRVAPSDAAEPSFFHAWCHGAPGIGLSRLALLDHWDDPELEAEIRVAVRATLAHGFAGRQCLCHGNFGNLELLDRAARRFEDAELRNAADELGGRILRRLESGDLRCGLDGQVDLPGLMTGLAGIGYGLLRLASPDTVPSVLLLETP